jgi:hypothetical protein
MSMESEMAADPGADRSIESLKAKIEQLKAELSELEAGKRQMGQKASGGDWEDITHKYKVWLKETIVELDNLIIKYSFPI